MKLKHNEHKKTQEKPLGKRARARMLAMQGVYQWLMTGYDYAAIEPTLHDEPGFKKADFAWFGKIFEGALDHRAQLEDMLADCIDRPISELSPIERAVLLVAAFELVHCIEVPFQVVINEAVELTKRFGGTDGHKYVNGVLNYLAQSSRQLEIDALARRQ